MKKSRNAEDSTLRNVKASARRDEALGERIRMLHALIVEQEARINQLEEFALTTAPREWKSLRGWVVGPVRKARR